MLASARVRSHWGYFAVLVFVALAFRSIRYLNFADFNSDFAFPALQAMHLQRGEWEPFLWGSNYQASVELALVGLFFKIFGPHPLVFLGVGTLGYLIAIGIAFACIAPTIGPLKTILLLLPLLIVTEPGLQLSLFPPRPWAMAVVIGSVFLFERSAVRKSALWMALAAFLQVGTLYLDFYFIQFLLPGLALGFLCAGKPLRKAWFAGMIAGALFVGATRLLVIGGPPLAFSPTRAVGKFQALFDCLRVLFGLYHSPTLFFSGITGRALYTVLACLTVILLLSPIAGAWYAWKHLPRENRLRRFSLYGFLLFGTSVVGFLGSSMSGNLQSSRYLVPVLWAIPFSAACLVVNRPPRLLALVLLPFAALIWNAAWIERHDLKFSLDSNRTYREALDFKSALESESIHYAMADYWIAFQLTYLWREAIVVAPIGGIDRYPEYSRAVRASNRIAKILIKSPENGNNLATEERAIRASDPSTKRIEVGRYVAFTYSSNASPIPKK